MGVLHWSPAAFRRATVWDAQRALRGYLRANGLDKDTNKSGTPPPLSQEKCEQLAALIEAFEAKERYHQNA